MRHAGRMALRALGLLGVLLLAVGGALSRTSVVHAQGYTYVQDTQMDQSFDNNPTESLVNPNLFKHPIPNSWQNLPPGTYPAWDALVPPGSTYAATGTPVDAWQGTIYIQDATTQTLTAQSGQAFLFTPNLPWGDTGDVAPSAPGAPTSESTPNAQAS